MSDRLWRWLGRLGCRVWGAHRRCWHTSPTYRRVWLVVLMIVAERCDGTLADLVRAVIEVLFGTDLD
ncbi:hypothetical protein [Granulicoccus sp. GXG6511]|uniref:hypothetical protein n=1 Tax=Granulicoccus sp. GXG6511 TaxID=3381351 RepID=UPI003D7E9880